MNHLLNTPFMQFAFRWDVIAVFVITGSIAVGLVIILVTSLFSGVRWR